MGVKVTPGIFWASWRIICTPSLEFYSILDRDQKHQLMKKVPKQLEEVQA